ncbi:von Willebrand factor A domain-containing protein 7 [Mixophyes fleayi]|uniref:von Willebrand factor A domain-containing protein 7 n=1 Tax=Mixophyes fleayi TaxID=3061075 RepID=UPI003F4E15AC
MSSSLPMLTFLLLWYLAIPGGHAFFPNFWSKFLSFTWGSTTHQDLTEEAVLNITLQILIDNRHPTRPPLRWEDFEGRTLIADEILEAYYGGEVSLRQFRASMRQIVSANANMDFLNGTRNDPIRHFDSERVRLGNSLLLRAREDLVRNLRAKEYEGARETLGQILHSLQDFYSHTNWVELGHTDVHPDLATPGRDISSIAGVSDQTCTDCTDVSCQNNIAAVIKKKHLLTSGYYGETPEKPQGKCSHGGPFDDSRLLSARGGINKDTATAMFSPHHFLHDKAAQLALRASIKFLSELRMEVTDADMLRLLGVSAYPALSIVLDTTGSMGEEITSARLQSRHIIERQRKTLLQPDYYILVPFNDPNFGPVYKTSDSVEFLEIMDSLYALGGGDEPEMCLSALQLALINTPPLSEIFVFTDASSKDIHLRNSVEALIQEKKIKVSFLITEDPSRTAVRSKRALLHPDRFDLYTDLASSSGGQILFTDNQDIAKVSEVIADSAHFDVVTLLHEQRSEGDVASYVFLVDTFLHNVILYINGDIKRFHIQDPTGRKQNGHHQTYGRFTRVFLSDPLQAGNWSIYVESDGPHSVRIQGRSSVDFLYYFGTPVNGSHPGLYQLNSQPVAGVSAILVVDVIGLPESANLSHVSLTSVSGEILTVELEKANQTGLLVAQVGHIPIGGFSVGVRGQDEKGLELKREAPQHLKAAECMLEISSDSPLTPGSLHPISLKITNFGGSHCYSVTMNNDMSKGSTTFRKQMGPRETQEKKMEIGVPGNAKHNMIVTVLAKAEDCNSNSPQCSTYLSLVVAEKSEAPSTSTPVCPLPSYSGSCPESVPPALCQDHPWSALLLVSDLEGIRSAQVLNGSGSTSHGPDGEYERVEFTSTCCTPQAELLLLNYRDATWHCSLYAPNTAMQMEPRNHWLLPVVVITSFVILALLISLAGVLYFLYKGKGTSNRDASDTDYHSGRRTNDLL